MYFVKTPKIIQKLAPDLLWRMPAAEPLIYLSFDDGPIPEVTPWTLDTLRAFDAKATFFCVGHNIDKHPEIYERLQAEGHTSGNHTYNHLNGWKTDNVSYCHNVRRCARLVKSNLFRPPYGRIAPGQRKFLTRRFRIVMWDVLSGDFDPRIQAETCLRHVTGNAGPGSIVVMHDSLKAEKNLRYALPRTLAWFIDKGYRFDSLSTVFSQG